LYSSRWIFELIPSTQEGILHERVFEKLWLMYQPLSKGRELDFHYFPP